MFNNLKPQKKISYLFLLVTMLSIPIAVGLVLNPKEFRLPRAETPITPPDGPTTSPSPVGLRGGDANFDGKVDGLDYLVWLRKYDKPENPEDAEQADFDGNGVVDGIDYLIWLSNFDF